RATGRGAAAAAGTLHDVEGTVEVDFHLCAVGFGDGHLVVVAGVVGGDGTRGATTDALDRSRLSLGGRITGNRLLGVLVSGSAVRREGRGRRCAGPARGRGGGRIRRGRRAGDRRAAEAERSQGDETGAYLLYA